ncbi:putative transcription factor B3-Domain family [Helianthus annuus]|nr:putative transcription factor B3-Domain family [Helianthus annuus]
MVGSRDRVAVERYDFVIESMDFMIILNVSELKEVTEGLVLPKILTNQIPRDCQVIKLVDYLGVKYKVAVENMGHRSKKIHGSEWIRFLESYKHKNIEKLCFKKVKEAKFEVFVLSNEGFEIRKDRSGKDYVHGCLVRASEETYYKQVKISYLVFIFCQYLFFGK